MTQRNPNQMDDFALWFVIDQQGFGFFPSSFFFSHFFFFLGFCGIKFGQVGWDFFLDKLVSRFDFYSRSVEMKINLILHGGVLIVCLYICIRLLIYVLGFVFFGWNLLVFSHHHYQYHCIYFSKEERNE